MRTALNKDLEALSRVYAERSKRLAQQTDTNHTMAFVLTCLGILALVVVVLGVLIIARSIARTVPELPTPPVTVPELPTVITTVHPSSVLRTPRESRAKAERAFFSDVRSAAGWLEENGGD